MQVQQLATITSESITPSNYHVSYSGNMQHGCAHMVNQDTALRAA